MDKIQKLTAHIAKERQHLLEHHLYKKIRHIDDLRKFTEGHVYAVWDFMSLLKALQIKLTCVSVPWFASAFPTTRHLINEIVLAEESDLYLDGRRLSHFEMYLDAMQDMGASTTGVTSFIADLQITGSLENTLHHSLIDKQIQEFLKFTFETIQTGEPHKIAAAFTFGREDLIPDMFMSILGEIQQNFPETDLRKLLYYFNRHIELDGNEHGPLALKMVAEVAGNDPTKWQEMADVAKEALRKRVMLWDAIACGIDNDLDFLP